MASMHSPSFRVPCADELTQLDELLGSDGHVLREVVVQDQNTAAAGAAHASQWAENIFGDAAQPVLHISGDEAMAISFFPTVVVVAPNGRVVSHDATFHPDVVTTVQPEPAPPGREF